MFKVSDGIQQKLIAMPESGMGFQIVEATYRDYSKKEVIIFNATLAEPTYNRDIALIAKSMLYEGLDHSIKTASTSTEIIDVELKKEKGFTKFASASKRAQTRGAKDSPVEYTQKGEHFIRFSLFEDDKRVNQKNRKLYPGTYATTYEDARYCIAHNINPVERYSLPYLSKPKYAFHIHPLEDTPIQRGTVQPANGQPGGGSEVFFTNGTDNDTVNLPPESIG